MHVGGDVVSYCRWDASPDPLYPFPPLLCDGLDATVSVEMCFLCMVVVPTGGSACAKIDGSGCMKRWDTWLDLVSLVVVLGDCDGSKPSLSPFSLPWSSREERGEVFISLLNMSRPFTAMKKLGMDEVKDIAKKIS